MSSSRTLELFLGLVTLVSVVSVPVPRKSTPPVSLAHPRLDLRKLEELHRESQEQRESVSQLARDTREFSNLLRSRRIVPVGGTVTVRRHPPIGAPQPENEEYECSQ